MKSPMLLALASAAVIAAPVAQARVTEVTITSRTPAFVDPVTHVQYSWPGVGTYERIVGIAKGEVDPNDPRNAVIVDLALSQAQSAPGQPGKTPSGMVAYSFNFYILKPTTLGNGNHRVMYEPPNRGGKTWTALARVSGGGDDPATIANTTVLANSFLMPRGYTMVWSGWEELGDLNALTASAQFPVAKNPGGSTITGPSYEYIVTGGNSTTLSYKAASTADVASAKLTHRVHLNALPETVPAFGTSACVAICWKYSSETAIGLVSPAGTPVNFVNNDIYEFSYTAKDPSPKGLGFAAVRDWNSWLKYDMSAANPLAGYIEKIYTEISSQPGRLLNDFRNLGFNEDEDGRKVLDGHMQWIAAGDGINMNYRFSQSGRTERNRQHHLYLEGRFPFANVYSHDPITGKTDSRYRRCEESNTCPLGVEIYSANEYWVKAASLLHTDPTGKRDLPDSQYTRNYFISSHQHGTGNAGTDANPNRGACQQRGNPLNSAPIQRALFIALDDWATNNRKPPDSQVPTFKDGTLVPPLPRSGMGFPLIPSPFADTPTPYVTYTGLKTTRYLFDYGPDFYETGIPTVNPPVITVVPGELPLGGDGSVRTTTYQDNPANGPIYPSYVPKTDADGNDIAGVRLPDVAVPLATYTGWALRSGPQASDGCESTGQMIPFPVTANAADPRRSVQDRYPTFKDYYTKVVSAIDDLVARRLYLCEDAQPELNRLVANGLTRGVPAPASSDVIPAAETFPHCQMERAGRSDHFK
jgi:alpha/beta hydrolase family protein